MTPAEAALVMGGLPPAGDNMEFFANGTYHHAIRGISSHGNWEWETVASERLCESQKKIDQGETWKGESLTINIWYCDGKAVEKSMETPVPPWKAKARDWLDWLSGLVGW
jgi:hypothetical protein